MGKKINYWNDYHEALNDEQKTKARDKVMSVCEYSQDTFYRKKRNPDSLKFWEKKLVAKSYGVKLTDFFPETELEPTA